MDLKDILPNGIVDWRLLAWFEKEAHIEYQPPLVRKYFKKGTMRKLLFNHATLDDLLGTRC